jgi:hypothetical protein
MDVVDNSAEKFKRTVQQKKLIKTLSHRLSEIPL